MNILFICSRNKWRSKTAETIFRNLNNFSVKSAGTEKSARIKINEQLINWSDLIFVMEHKHKNKQTERFDQLMENKEIIVLDITDDYKYMDEELIQHLKESVSFHLNL